MTHNFNSPHVKISRRDFVRSSVAGATAFIPKEKPKLVIVGAGIGGLTTAYRLSRAGIACEIYEASARTGGRILTQTDFVSGGMHCELGAEYIDSGQTALRDLAKEIGLTIENLKEDTSAEPYYFINKQVYSEREFITGLKAVAGSIKSDIDILSPTGALEVPTYNSKLSHHPRVIALDRLPLAAYLESLKNVDRWMIDLLDVAYRSEYGLETSAQSTLNFLVLIAPITQGAYRIFGDSDESGVIRGGNEQLTSTLTRLLKLKSPIFQNHGLVAIKKRSADFKLVFDNAGVTKEVVAKRVVLALPLSVLRNVDGIDKLGLSKRKLQFIKELGYGTNSKLILGFNERFWLTPQAKIKTPLAELISNQSSQRIWDASRKQSGKAGMLTSFFGGKDGAQIPPNKLSQTLAQIEHMYPAAKASFASKQISKHWPSDSFAKGSYSCPTPGQYTSLIGCASEPELDNRIFFVGEHCSVDYGGFMNGAVESANQVALQLQK
jgi:monoamine oxidase